MAKTAKVSPFSIACLLIGSSHCSIHAGSLLRGDSIFKSMTFFDQKNLRIFLIIWGVFLAGILTLGGLFVFNRMAGSDKLIQAQVEVYKAQAQQQGKPTVIEQYYNTPTK